MRYGNTLFLLKIFFLSIPDLYDRHSAVQTLAAVFHSCQRAQNLQERLKDDAEIFYLIRLNYSTFESVFAERCNYRVVRITA